MTHGTHGNHEQQGDTARLDACPVTGTWWRWQWTWSTAGAARTW